MACPKRHFIGLYAGYNKLTKVTHCNCWAHLRRKFHEAIVVDSGDSIARTGRDFCDKLFAIEAELDSLTNEERYNKRLTQEKEVFEAFWSWAEKIYPTVLAKTQLGKAFDYAFKRREYLGNYFQNGSCAISNNILYLCLFARIILTFVPLSAPLVLKYQPPFRVPLHVSLILSAHFLQVFYYLWL